MPASPRLVPFVLASLLSMAGTRAANATCIEEVNDGVTYACCTGEGTNETTCTVRSQTPPPMPPPRLTCHMVEHDGDPQECCAPIAHSSDYTCGRPGWSSMQCAGPTDDKCFGAGPGAWDRARRDHFTWELVVGVLAGAARREITASDPMGSHAAVGGLDVKLRLLYRWQASGSTTDRLLGIVPYLFIGNDFGIELRAGTMASRRDGDVRNTSYVAIRPLGLISERRLRATALLNFVPEVGVSKREGESAAFHWGMRMPFGLIVTRRVGVELELGIGADLGYSAAVSAIIR